MPIIKNKNENFFKKWSPEMAYVLGFFAADGNLTVGRRGNHYLEFTSCDRDIMEKIKTILESDNKISERKSLKNNHKNSFRIQIGSKILFRDLIFRGFTTNKSKAMVYPEIPDQYFPDFVRGYFDGDGHVTTGIYPKKGRPTDIRLLLCGFTSGTKNFLERLWINLIKQGIVRGGTLYYSRGYRLNFSINDSLGLYKFLYNGVDNGLYLARKKQVFEKYINAVVA